MPVVGLVVPSGLTFNPDGQCIYYTMAAIFIGNEFLRRYHTRLVFAALLLFFSIYSYTILLPPHQPDRQVMQG